MKFRIFISSVQQEFAEERRMLAEYIRRDPLLGVFFEVFLFEETPACDVAAPGVYLPEVGASDIYLGLLGAEYGNARGGGGLSPTEREYGAATAGGKERLVFVRRGVVRDPREERFLRRVQSEVVRKSFSTPEELKAAVYAALVRSLEARGCIRTAPFDVSFDTDCTLDGLDADKVADYLRRARSARKITIPDDAGAEWLLGKLEALSPEGKVSNAGVLLFAKNPQSAFMSAEVKCLQYWGTEIERPIPSYHIYGGGLLGMIENAVSFVMDRTGHEVGAPQDGAAAPGRNELPYLAVREAVVNAVCHRDYVSHGGVQVMVFRDRVEIINPGTLPKGWTAEMLARTHHSEPRNECIAKALNWAGYVERSGNGTEAILARCAEYGLATPEYKAGAADFRTIIWRRAARPSRADGRQGQATGPQGQTTGPRQGQPVGPVEWPSRVFEAIRAEGEASKADIAAKIGHPRTSGNIKRALRLLLADGLVEYTIPGTPRSRFQKYRLTDKGRELGVRPVGGEEGGIGGRGEGLEFPGGEAP